MKKTILICVILFSLQATNAQNTYYKLIDTNKVWNNIDTNPPWEYTIFYKFSSDTLMDGFTYHWLKQSADSVNWFKMALLREDTISKKVFLYGYSSGVFQGGEGLIYDFSAEVGDTLTLFNIALCNDSCKIVVTDIDSVLVGNQNHKRFISVNSGSIYPVFWIEGVGAENGLYHMGYNYSCIVGGYFPRLVCYHENDSLMYVNPYYGQCFTTILGIADNENQAVVNVKSLGNNAFSIQANEPVKEIAVYNITGQKIHSKSCNTKETSFNLSDCQQGVYFVKILLENNIVDVKKVMKL